MGFELVDQATKKPLKLKSVSVDITVQAFISKTSVTLVFENETDKDVEGELVFPLEEGSTVCNYAVDVNGVLVEGVPCEKEKARKVFEDEVREKKSGPALAEHVAGNVFKTRIYPIRQKSTRTVRVGFLFDLDSSKVGELKYKLPLSTPVLDSFSLEALVATSENSGTPQISARGIFRDEQVPSFRINQKARVFNLSAQLESVNLNGDLIFTIPNVPMQQYMIEKATPFANQEFEETNEAISTDTTDYYFVLCDTIAGDSSAKKGPTASDEKFIGLIWDCSFSRGKSKANREKEFSLLEAFIRNVQSASFFVFELRETFLEKPTLIRVTNSNPAPLISHLKQISCDGGTNFGSAKFSRSIKYGNNNTEYTISYYLLFTDGFSSVGSDSPSIVESPVYSFSAEEVVNSNPLKVVAKRSNGEYFNLYNNSNFSEISQKIGNVPFGFVGTKYAEGTATGVTVTEVYPQSSTSLKGKTFKVAGKIQIPNTNQRPDDLSTEISVCYGFGGNVTQTIKYRIRVSEDEGTGLLGRYWALKKLEELQLFPESDENQQLILQIGKQYNLITPNTSFLVLETLEQYVKHEITPPDSLLDLKTEYIKIVTEKRKQKKDLIEDKIQMVLDFWERRVSWWNTSYEVPQWQPDIVHCVSHRKNYKIDFKDFTNPLYWKPEPPIRDSSSSIPSPLEEQPKEEEREDVDDFEKFKNHPFFAEIDFDKLARKEIPPPFIPPVKSSDDTSNIDPMFTSERPQDSLVEEATYNVREHDYFHNFTFSVNGETGGSSTQYSYAEDQVAYEADQNFENFHFVPEGANEGFSYGSDYGGLPDMPPPPPITEDLYGSPPPPPLRSPPTSPRSSLLSSIKSGAKLKKTVSIDKAVPESKQLSLADGLLSSMLSRRASIAEDDDEGGGGGSDWSDSDASEEEKEEEESWDEPVPVATNQKEKEKDAKDTLFGALRSRRQSTMAPPIQEKEKEISSMTKGISQGITNARGGAAPSPKLSLAAAKPATTSTAKQPTSTATLGKGGGGPAAPAPMLARSSSSSSASVYGRLPVATSTSTTTSSPFGSIPPPAPQAFQTALPSLSSSAVAPPPPPPGGPSLPPPPPPGAPSFPAMAMPAPPSMAPPMQQMYFAPPPPMPSPAFYAPPPPMPPSVGLGGPPPPPGAPRVPPPPGAAPRGPPPPPARAPAPVVPAAAAPPPIPRSPIAAPSPPPQLHHRAASPPPSTPVTSGMINNLVQQQALPQRPMLFRAARADTRVSVGGSAEESKSYEAKPLAREDRDRDDRRGFSRRDDSRDYYRDREPPRGESKRESERRDDREFRRDDRELDRAPREEKAKSESVFSLKKKKAKQDKKEEKKSEKRISSDICGYLAPDDDDVDLFGSADTPSLEVAQTTMEGQAASSASLFDYYHIDNSSLNDIPPPEPFYENANEFAFSSIPASSMAQSFSYTTPYFGSMEAPTGMASVSSFGCRKPDSDLDKYDLLNVVGKGSFGKTLQVKEKSTGSVKLMETRTTPFKQNKDEIIQVLDHPFLTKVTETFSTDSKNYVIVEDPKGGELFFFLQRQGRFNEVQARFFTAELALAVHHLHEKGIILKSPEQLNVRGDGHIELRKLDLLFEGASASDPYYLAPEVLKGQAPTRASDWWSVGALLYEMLMGLPPFYSNDPEIILQKIMTTELKFPTFVSEPAKSFLTEILFKDPDYRLGTKNKPPPVQAAPKRTTPEIDLEPWKPATSFGKELEEGKMTASASYDKYLKERENRKDDVWFFIDAAQYLWKQNSRELALRVLTSVAELELENAQLLRNVGYLLEQFDEISLAIQVFRKVKKLRGEEPQSNRDLATVLAKSGIKENLEEAINLLKQVVEKDWHPRFHQIEVTATTESNRLLNLMKYGRFAFQNVQNYQTDKRFLAPVDVDVRVVLYWDTDNTNVELLCEEPNGETCFALNNHSKIGGMMSRDFTGGYGPVEYQIRKAQKGDYKIKVKLMTPAVVEGNSVMACVKIFTNYGRPGSEEEKITVVPLSKFREVVDVATVNIP